MLAWVVDPTSRAGLALREVPDPVALPHEAVVRVDAFAPNPGDVVAVGAMPSGAVPGWDGSGVVVRGAADGRGLQPGQRVLFLGAGGGWAQQRAVPHATLAVAPHDAAAAQLATLPVPATSALRAVRRLGSVVGRRVLVVGATSAVGAMAVQLAARSGAHVVAVARDAGRHTDLRRLGAAETHADPGSIDARVHGAIDVIGGRHLVDAYALLEAGGTAIALGHAAGAEERFPFGAFVADPMTADRSITSFFLGSEPDLAREMAYLATEVHEGRLEVGPIAERPWRQVGDWLDAGAERGSERTVFAVDHDEA